jgi:hypothetical protein
MRTAKKSGALPSWADQQQAVARQIDDDARLSNLPEVLSAEDFQDLLTQLSLLARLKVDLVNGATLDEYVAAARKDRNRVAIAKRHRDGVLEKFRLYGDEENDFTGELLLAEHALKRAIERQALGKFLDDRKLSRRGPSGRDDMKVFNGWAVKLIAERLPNEQQKQFAQIAKLLKIAGITASRQTVRRILTEAKQ